MKISSKKGIKANNNVLNEIEKRGSSEYVKNELTYKHYPKNSINYGKNNAKWVSINYANALRILNILQKDSKIPYEDVSTFDSSDLKKFRAWRVSLVVQCNSENPIVEIVVIHNNNASYKKNSYTSYYWCRRRMMYRFNIGEKKCICRDILLFNFDPDLGQHNMIVDERKWFPGENIKKMVQEDIIKADIRQFMSYRSIINNFWMNGVNRRKKKIKLVNSFDFIIYLPREIVDMCLDYFDNDDGIFIGFVDVNSLV
jgi:hypothetical protein